MLTFAQAGAGLTGSEAAGQASRMHAGHVAHGRDSMVSGWQEGGQGGQDGQGGQGPLQYLPPSRDGTDGAPISDEELASAKVVRS